MSSRGLIAFAAGILAPVAAARAAGPGGALDSGTIYNAVWSIAIFAGLALVLGRFAWRPVLRAVLQREKHIADTLAHAAERQARSEKLMAELEAKVHQTDRQVADRLQAAKADAEEARRQILAAARAEADKLGRQAAEEITAAKKRATEELYVLAGGLATDVAERILRRQLDAADQQRLIEQSLLEIRRQATWS